MTLPEASPSDRVPKVSASSPTDVAEVLSRDHAVLVDRILQVLVREVPAYSRLPIELIEQEVRGVAALAVRLFAQSVHHEGRPPQADLDRLSNSAADRAEEGVPLDMVLSAYFRGAQVCAEHLTVDADAPLPPTILPLLTTFMGEVSKAVGVGYERFARMHATESASHRIDLATALLAGQSTEEIGAGIGADVAARYRVICLEVARNADEDALEVDSLVANRRKLRRVRAEVSRRCPEALWAPGARAELLLLLPADAEPAPPGAANPFGGASMARLADVAGAGVWAGMVLATPVEIPEAVTVGRELARLARSSGRPVGAYSMADLAIDYQLSRPGPALSAIAAPAGLLADHPELMATLEAHLRTGGDRRSSATQLHVHANTVDNRLRRIASLTSLDPTDPQDLLALAAARHALRALSGGR